MNDSFASGYNFYKIIWTFIIFSVFGFFFEIAMFYLQHGRFLMFFGLLHIPFSQVYGLAAVIAVSISSLLRKVDGVIVFLFFSFLGAVYEYIMSVIEERVFGFVSWEYSKITWNVGGRTTITLAFIWGVMAMFIVLYLYPFVSRQIERIPNRKGIVLTWLVIVILFFDAVLTVSALQRYGERHDNLPPSNSYEEYLDAHYPDEHLLSIMPSLQYRK